MHKIYFTSGVFILAVFVSASVYAANTQGSGMQPLQNQVQTQNQGVGSQIQVGTQEQQGVGTGKGVNANAQKPTISGKTGNLNVSMSSVAQQVQKLLSTQAAAGGIGAQVREWARAQSQTQDKIQVHLAKIESKAGLAKSLFGPNFGSLKEIKQEVQQNRVRIQQLTQLKLKLTNQADITNVQEMISLMEQENTALLEKVTLEEQADSVFGWLVKLFIK